MTPNKLVFSETALAELERRGRVLRRERGADFAKLWTESIFAWLGRHAELGDQVGTEHPGRPGFRTFGYKRQATVLAEYADGELRIVRVYFSGQDWTR